VRNICGSRLIRYGESVKTVQARLGHARTAETLDSYNNPGPTPTTNEGRRRLDGRESCGLPGDSD
jgi:hypothetical protein